MHTITGMQNYAGTFIFQGNYEDLPVEHGPLTLNLHSSSGTEEAAAVDVASTLQRTNIPWLHPLEKARGPWIVDRTELASFFNARHLPWLRGEQLVRPIFDRVEFTIVLRFVFSEDGPLAWGYTSQTEATGWSLIDRLVAKLRSSLESATAPEDFQSVGLLSRDAIIVLAQAVYDPENHVSADGVRPGHDDAKRMLGAYFASVLAGGEQEHLRNHAKSALGLAVHLQHKRTAGFKDAALCAEATVSLINIVAILEGRHG